MNKRAKKKVGKSFEELTPEEMNKVQGSYINNGNGEIGGTWSWSSSSSSSSSSSNNNYSLNCSYGCWSSRCGIYG